MAKKSFSVDVSSKEGLTEITDEVMKYEQYIPAGVKLSPVKYVAHKDLKENPLNKKYFTQDQDYIQQLTEDIRQRGIIVPLIAKRDGLLLAGHVRLQIARNIDLLMVPLQYVLSDLTPKQERDFLLKDNVLRRQLSPAQKEHLIRELYGEEIFVDRRGGDRKSPQAKIKSSREPLIPLHERVAEDTGGQITPGTAKRVLAKVRKEQKEETKPAKPKPQKLVCTFRAPSIEDLIKQLEAKIVELKQELAKKEG